jgi:hypothetical protein
MLSAPFGPAATAGPASQAVSRPARQVSRPPTLNQRSRPESPWARAPPRIREFSKGRAPVKDSPRALGSPPQSGSGRLQVKCGTLGAGGAWVPQACHPGSNQCVATWESPHDHRVVLTAGPPPFSAYRTTRAHDPATANRPPTAGEARSPAGSTAADRRARGCVT